MFATCTRNLNVRCDWYQCRTLWGQEVALKKLLVEELTEEDVADFTMEVGMDSVFGDKTR